MLMLMLMLMQMLRAEQGRRSISEADGLSALLPLMTAATSGEAHDPPRAEQGLSSYAVAVVANLALEGV